MVSHPILKITSLSKSFSPGVSAVDGVSFSLSEGEILCLLGPSGCGKTTLLRMIAGLEQADAGQIIFAGRNVAPIPPHQRDFGMMFQDYALFPHQNVFENVAFGLKMRGDKPESVKAQVTAMLEQVNLSGFEGRDISQLSGGEQQRVALARALAPGPRLLLLDEPLGALDRALRERLMLDLRTILKQVGVTAIYVTHDQTEAFAIADRIAVMHAGQIAQLDTPQAIYARPASAVVARFLGFENVLTGKIIAEGKVETALGVFEFPVVHNVDEEKGNFTLTPTLSLREREHISPSLGGIKGGRVTLLIKPNALDLETPAPENRLEGIITAISFRGKYYQVWLKSGEQALMFEAPSAEGLAVGDTLSCGLKKESIVVL